MGVQGALASIRSGVDELNASDLWARTDAPALDDLRNCWNLLQRLESGYAALVADLELRVLSEGLNTKAFLRSALNRTQGQAAGDVRAFLKPLPLCLQVFRSGEMSRAHVDVIAKTLEQIPEETRHREVPRRLPELGGDSDEPVSILEALDAFFAHRAPVNTSAALQNMAHAVLAALKPDADDGFDEHAYESRGETHARDDHGMLYSQMNLDAAAGADYAAALDFLSRPHPTRTETAEDGTTVEIKDTRTPGQRRADAVGLMARLAMSAAQAGTRGGEPPRVVLYTGIEDYADTHCTDPTHAHATCPPEPGAPEPGAPEPGAPEPGAPEPSASETVSCPASRLQAPEGAGTGRAFRGRAHGATDTHLGTIGPRLLARFACDAVLQVALMHPSGAILDLGRDARTVSPAQRRALTARDRGCVIPGCTAPAAWCDGHHVTYWEKGGLTNLDNLALVCGQHHTAVHLGLWELRVSDGVPWARASLGIDPLRRWIRNTFHDDVDVARGLGVQMRLARPAHDPPPPRRPDHQKPPPEQVPSSEPGDPPPDVTT